jgi:two-component system KDP operon response regulator KdpE
MKPIIVVIDDEAPIRRLFRAILEAGEYSVFEAANGQQGMAEVALRHPDVVLLDLGLPDLDGMDVLARIREWSNVPVLVASVRDKEQDKIAALRNGADDFLTKPFSTAQLLTRLQSLLRLPQAAAEETVFASGPLTVDLALRAVRVNGRAVKLTWTEYALLRILVRHAGKMLTYSQIVEFIWGPGNREKTHYLHVYMTHLREKIEPAPGPPALLISEPRAGYRLKVLSPIQAGNTLF